MNLRENFFLCVAIAGGLLIGGCNTTSLQRSIGQTFNTDGSAASETDTSYNLFFGPEDHLGDLLRSNSMSEAGGVYVKNRQFFDANATDESVSLVVTELKRRWKQDLSHAFSELDGIDFQIEDSSNWRGIKNDLKLAEAVYQRSAASRVLGSDEDGGNLVVDLKSKLGKVRERIGNLAPQAMASSFADFVDHESFFNAYPTSVNRAQTSADALSILTEVDNPDFVQLAAMTRSDFGNLAESRQQELAGILYAAACDGSKRQNFGTLLCKAHDLGKSGLLELDPFLRRVPVRFVNYVPDAEVSVDFDTVRPLVINPESVGSLPSSVQFVAIVAARSGVNTERDEIESRTVESRFVYATQTVPNPRYLSQQQTVNQLTVNYASAAQSANISQLNSNNCYGIGCLGAALGTLGAEIGASAARSELETATNTLASISPTIEKDLFESYEYTRTEFLVRRSAEISFVVLNREAGASNVYVASLSDQDKFNINSGVHDKDPGNYGLLAGKRKMEEFLDSPVSSDLVAIFNDLLDAKPVKKLSGGHSGAKKYALIKTKPSTKVATLNSSVSPGRYGHLIKSVVQVQTEDALGAGFFVSGDLIVSNHHVIEGSKYVDVILSDGTTSFGKVVKTSPTRDLALIQVKAAGKPVTLINNAFGVGDEVIAAGHPEGLSFTVTRGIVSSIRSQSVSGSSGLPVKLIQTDAAINPGNSGGPLFLDGKVVGVNTMKYGRAEGLSFAVHIDEVRDFLDQ